MAKNSPITSQEIGLSHRKFSLKILMIAVVLAGCVFAWAGGRYRQSMHEQADLRAIAKAFPHAIIRVWYQSQKNSDGGYASTPTTPDGDIVKWLIGDSNAFERVTRITISSPPSDTMFSGGRPNVAPDSESSETNRDYLRFPKLQGLKYLDEIEVAIHDLNSLEGLNELKSLRKILLYGCLAIKNVDELEGLTNLSELEIDSCHSLENLDGIGGLNQLTNVKILRCNSLPPKTQTKTKGSGLFD